LEAETGSRPGWIPGAFTDPFDDVRRSIATLRACPYLVERDMVTGFVYDVDSSALLALEGQG
jgi:carbonic anhydrase